MASQHVADPDQRRRSPLRAAVRVRPRPDLVSARLAALFVGLALGAGSEATMANAKDGATAGGGAAPTARARIEIASGWTFRKVAHKGANVNEADAWLPAT